MFWTRHFVSDQIGKKSVQIRRISVIRGLSFRRNCFASADRPRMTLIRRIYTDTTPSLAKCLFH